MRLLLSAYACAPKRGSEWGVGWNWAVEASRLGHDVYVLVAPCHRDAISVATRKDPTLSKIHWIFPEVAFWPLCQAKEPRWERTYNLLWQVAALTKARALQRDVSFDVIHHLTWGGIRAPTFLGSLGVPLIIGPLGGGETSPASLRDRLSFKGKVLEWIRDCSNATILMNPLVRRGFNDAEIILAMTGETRDILGPSLRDKTQIMMALDVSLDEIGSPRIQYHSPPKLLFAGRLLYWKGVHIAIETLAILVKLIPDLRLTIVGCGPEEKRLRADVASRNLNGNVDFFSTMPQDKFMSLYDTHDLLLFPSLHDGSGCVVLEALAHGMPVACLDLGGPKEIVSARSAIVVNTKSRTTTEVAQQLANEIYRTLSSPSLFQRLSAGAIDRAKEFLLSEKITKLYDLVVSHSKRSSDVTPPIVREQTMN